MQLARFLETAREPIMVAVASYARSIPALRDTDEKTLRDHLPHLLDAIAADLRNSQSRAQSIAKSLGDGPVSLTTTSAQIHGLLRAQRGITIEQLVAEFRALRSSILRLWTDAYPVSTDSMEEINRFHEAVDQAVAESVEFFAQERERWRQIFLGVLGHDLRGPLNAVGLTVQLMRKRGSAPADQVELLSRGVKRLSSLLDSLLEYNRAGFGTGMVLHRGPTDVAAICAAELELLKAALPEAHIDFDFHREIIADVDPSQVREALANLVTNAVKHGLSSRPVTVSLEDGPDHISLMVENAGHIPPEEIELLFEPLRQRETPSVKTERTHLGLGLFIARQIARAHGGDATGCSGDGLVRFTIELPKTA